MRVFHSALAMVLFIGAFGANAQESPSPAEREEDAYLLGMMGMGHVLILHDYVGMISESFASGARLERAAARLSLIDQHCGELIGRIKQRDRPPLSRPNEFSLEQLVELLGMVQEEARALREMIESPSRNSRRRFIQARSRVAGRLQQVKSDSQPETSSDEETEQE